MRVDSIYKKSFFLGLRAVLLWASWGALSASCVMARGPRVPKPGQHARSFLVTTPGLPVCQPGPRQRAQYNAEELPAICSTLPLEDEYWEGINAAQQLDAENWKGYWGRSKENWKGYWERGREKKLEHKALLRDIQTHLECTLSSLEAIQRKNSLVKEYPCRFNGPFVKNLLEHQKYATAVIKNHLALIKLWIEDSRDWDDHQIYLNRLQFYSNSLASHVWRQLPKPQHPGSFTAWPNSNCGAVDPDENPDIFRARCHVRKKAEQKKGGFFSKLKNFFIDDSVD